MPRVDQQLVAVGIVGSLDVNTIGTLHKNDLERALTVCLSNEPLCRRVRAMLFPAVLEEPTLAVKETLADLALRNRRRLSGQLGPDPIGNPDFQAIASLGVRH